MEIKNIIEKQIKEIENENIKYLQEEADFNISNLLAKQKIIHTNLFLGGLKIAF
jgi:hypothetical protein